MGATFIHRGDAIDYRPATDVTAGDVVQLNDLVGVAKVDIPANALGSLHLVGVFSFPKNTGAGEDIAMGARLYWGPTGQVVLKTQTATEVELGRAVEAAGEDDTTVQVRLKQ